MTEFLQALQLYPTLVFTIFLGLASLYWVMVILGGVDLDIFSGAEGAAEGAAEGIAEGLAEGAAEGLAEGATEGLIEGVAEGAAEGVAEGAAEGVSESTGSVSPLGAFFALLNLRGVPITVTMSVVVLTAWTCSILVTPQVMKMMEFSTMPFLMGSGIGLASLMLGFVVASIALRPLKKVFASAPRKIAQQTIIGKSCTILTGSVSNSFGQGEYDDDAGGLILEVRCDTPNSIRQGMEVLVIDYDAKEHVYLVEPVDAFQSLAPAPTMSLEEEIEEAARVHHTQTTKR